jgi:hypothetical protein
VLAECPGQGQFGEQQGVAEPPIPKATWIGEAIEAGGVGDRSDLGEIIYLRGRVMVPRRQERISASAVASVCSA